MKVTTTSASATRPFPAAAVSLLFLLAVLISACTSNPGSGGLLDAQGHHPSGFSSSHGSFASPDNAACTGCHGGDLLGGISGVPCSRCHIHPATWLDCTYMNNGTLWHGTASQSNVPVCATCHDMSPASPLCTRTCHFRIPTAIDQGRVPGSLVGTWEHGVANHHQAAILDNAAVGSVCVKCHDTHNRFGQAPVCHNCHGGVPNPHPATWLDCTYKGNVALWHGTASQINVPVCADCHDVSPTSPKCTLTCHFGIPTAIDNGRVPSSLVGTWSHGRGTAGTSTSHHRAAINDNAVVTSVCIACHDTHNRFGQPPVCHNCHGAENPHPDGWLLSHDTQARTSTAACATAECHGTTLQGASGRACAACHKGEELLSHPAECRSCHGWPPPGPLAVPVPAGYPNIAGAHARHGALPGVGALCTPCHAGAGMETARHFDNAVDVLLPAAYGARSGGPARYGAAGRSCLGISCHGGQTTPDWRVVDPALRGTGTCTRCHKSAAVSPPQWNDWTDVRMTTHTRHIVSEGFACARCHSTALMPNSLHFGTLTDNVISSADARATLFANLSYAGGGAQCGGSGATVAGCHD